MSLRQTLKSVRKLLHYRKAKLIGNACRLGLFMMAKWANRSNIHGLNGWNASKRFDRSRNKRINTLIDEWCAFSSNHRLCRMAAKWLCMAFDSKCVSASNLRIFCGNVAMRIFTFADRFEMSNPLSFNSVFSTSALVTTSVFITIFRSSCTFFDNASHASFVGNVFRMTTISATLWPVTMVPFLNEPTWRTSSNCCREIYRFFFLLWGNAKIQRDGKTVWSTYACIEIAGSHDQIVKNALYFRDQIADGRLFDVCRTQILVALQKSLQKSDKSHL